MSMNGSFDRVREGVISRVHIKENISNHNRETTAGYEHDMAEKKGLIKDSRPSF